ncbi:Glycogen synthase 1 [Usitatibacter rugosus]|uniref:Glycogen synthase n=1 Tax=Usitatibacter rugosus TaxID=2732067 RepID=A0A6M4GVG2_9PROT|nr:glycogen synthase GlgA [Usitatibacter rugosus]QJR11032.1 Glycogen synthase 1 [Usitatibacter rugosus]
MAERVLFVTSECAPWSKTGGLADVSSSLPYALRELGLDVRVLVPAYSSTPPAPAAPIAVMPPSAGLPGASLAEATLPNGVPALLLQSPSLYARPGGPYQTETGSDWPDNAKRFAQLARAAAWLASEESDTPWRPTVVHANDWQASMAPVYLRHSGSKTAARSVVTIHNLAFQGLFDADVVAAIGLPPEAFASSLEYYGRCSFLKGGLVTADAITTVSPTYAAEIQTEAEGMGMAGILRSRARNLHGIVNGIDTAAWDPSKDSFLARTFDADRLDAKRENTAALRERMGLPASDGPLLGMVSRLAKQKGTDLVLAIAPALESLGAQVVFLGAGDADLEEAIRALVASRPSFAAAHVGFDESLAHQIEAGADLFLMPSRFEPCGMNQMYSQRYGTVPVVRSTGGLVDTVVPYDAATGKGTGFAFRDPTPDALLACITQALEIFKSRDAWRTIQRAGMARDFSWNASARRYADLYSSLHE